MVVSQTSPRLKPQHVGGHAHGDAAGWRDTSTLGKVVGSRAGSFMVLS